MTKKVILQKPKTINEVEAYEYKSGNEVELDDFEKNIDLFVNRGEEIAKRWEDWTIESPRFTKRLRSSYNPKDIVGYDVDLIQWRKYWEKYALFEVLPVKPRSIWWFDGTKFHAAYGGEIFAYVQLKTIERAEQYALDESHRTVRIHFHYIRDVYNWKSWI